MTIAPDIRAVASRLRAGVLAGLVLATALVPGGAGAAVAAVVASGGDTYAPFHFTADGEPCGFDVDLIRAVARTIDLDLQVRLMPWEEARAALADGSVQIHVGMTASPERRDSYRFCSPHLSQQYRIFVRRDHRDLAGVDDLAGKRLIVQREGVMARWVVAQGYTTAPLEAANAADALRMLAAGEGDACLMSELRGLYVARELGLDNLRRVGDPVLQTFHGFAVITAREDLVPRLNQGLAILEASGEYDRIYDRWFGLLDDSRPSPSDYLRWAGWVIVPLGAAFLFASLWSWSLRRQVNRQTVALRRARDQAQAASEAKSNFLATMSHEIRTPLNGVLGMSQLLMGSGLTEDQADQVVTIRKSAQALQAIITDILDFSRIEAGERALEAIAFAPAALCEDSLDIVRPMALGKGLELSVTGLADLPGALIGDPTALRQVLLNLLGNAVKFTDRGFVRLDVQATPGDGDRLVLAFAVSDSGVGVPPGQEERLFDSFTQADSSTTRRFGGTGLGLAICRDLVRLMGGGIGMSPREGGGSVFRFSVELAPAADATAPAPAREAPGDDGPWDPAGLHVLLVEDNPLNQRVMALLLKRQGMTLTLAVNGRMAVAAAGRESFDVILMDCQMPLMDGFEATRALRSAERAGGAARTPIIALTAGALRTDRDKCLAAGMDDYVTKPVDSAVLLRTIRKWLGPRAPVGAA